MRILFFFLGVPLMLMSFFEAVDVMPYVSSSNLIVNGNEIVLSEEEQTSLEEQILSMLGSAHTLPAFGVVFNDMYQEIIKEGTFVSLKFDKILEINELPFDELVFKVDPEFQSFDMIRGMNGVFQGRCIHIDLLGNNMQALQSFIDSLPQMQEVPAEIPEEDENNADFEEDATEQENESGTEDEGAEENIEVGETPELI